MSLDDIDRLSTIDPAREARQLGDPTPATANP